MIKPTKFGGAILSTLLASIGIPLALDMIKKVTGKGSPRVGRPKQGNGSPRIGLYQPPPFLGNWPQNTISYGKKKSSNKKKTQKGKGILLGKNSPFKNVPLLNILL